MAFARRTDDAQHRSAIRSTPKGIEAVVFFLVDTDDIAIALQAPGLPAADDPLDPVNYPTVLCYNVSTEDKYGGDDASSGRIGWSWVRVDYATPGAGRFTTPNLYPGQKWTEIRQAETAEHYVKSPFDGSSLAINRGEGVSVEVGLTFLVISRCWDLDHQPDFAYYNTLNKYRAFNQSAITVPKLFGAGAAWTVPEKTAQYKGFETQVEGKALIVRHTLQIGLSPLYKWYKQIALNGLVVEDSAEFSQVYNVMEFVGLW